MHEISIATSIIDSVIELAAQNNAKKVKEISIEIGKLAMIDKEQLKFGIEILANDTICKGMDVEIKFLPVKIKCKNKHITTIDEDVEFLDIPKYLKCGKCGDNEGIEILQGKEILIRKVVFE